MYAKCVVAACSAYALFYHSCPASHNIHRVKFCVKAFLCPTVGDVIHSFMLIIYSNVDIRFGREATK